MEENTICSRHKKRNFGNLRLEGYFLKSMESNSQKALSHMILSAEMLFFLKNQVQGFTWWYTPVILELRRKLA